MKKLTLIVVLSVCLFVLMIGTTSAAEISLGDWCPGNWDGTTCTVTSASVLADSTLIILSGERLNINILLVNGGTIDNAGIIWTLPAAIIDNDNGGTITNRGTIGPNGSINNEDGGTIDNDNGGRISVWHASYNYGRINNKYDGTIDNWATYDNVGVIDNNGGTLFNWGNGTLQNHGTINNYNGGIIANRHGIFVNNGYLKNGDGYDHTGAINNHYGTITNNGVFDNWCISTITNRGTIVNNNYLASCGTVTNRGTIDNNDRLYNYGVFYNKGLIAGNPIINIEPGVIYELIYDVYLPMVIRS